MSSSHFLFALILYSLISVTVATEGPSAGGCALLVHATDADSPPQTGPILRGLSKYGFSVTVLCGTRACHDVVAGLGDVAAALRMLRIPRLVEGTPLQTTFYSQESLSLLRLWLPGQRFEHAVEAAAAVAGLSDLARNRSCSRLLYLNHFWDGFLGTAQHSPSNSQLDKLLAAGSPAALLDQKRLAALWLPGGDADVPRLLAVMQRMGSLLHMPPGRELLTPAPRDGWLQEALCGMTEWHAAATAFVCMHTAAQSGSLSGRWHGSNATRSFHAVGYGAQAGWGCRGNGRSRLEFFEGDHFQTLAVLQYLPRLDGFVDVTIDQGAERLGKSCPQIAGDGVWPAQPAAGGRAYVLMSARWHRLGKHNGSTKRSWPPPGHVTPVLVGFRIERRVAQAAALRQWFNEWGPVGARDEASAQRLGADGVTAVNAACVTLGLRTWICPGRGHMPNHSPCACQAAAADTAASSCLGASPAFNASLPTALVFGYPDGICASSRNGSNSGSGIGSGGRGSGSGGNGSGSDGGSGSPPHLAALAGVQMVCGMRHNWLKEGMPREGSFAAFDMGMWYDLQSRAGRLQLAVNKLRALRRAALLVTGRYFHVVLPAVALGVPPLFVNGSEAIANETRFDGLKQLFTQVRVDPSAPAAANTRALEAAAAAAWVRRPASEEERCAVDGRLAPAGSHPDGSPRAPRDELYRRQLRLLSRHAPLLDAMNRLGSVDALMDDVAAADVAWIRGELPYLLRPAAGMEVGVPVP